MLKYWRDRYLDRGHTAGGMFIKGNVCYVPIPKNSTSYIGNLLLRDNWDTVNFLTMSITNEVIIVLLRDPINRWVSGMAQYLYSTLTTNGRTVNDIIKNWNSLLTELIFDQVIFDDHTESQSYFIKNLPIEQCVFFDSTNNPEVAIKNYLAEHNIELSINDNNIDRNRTTSNEDIVQLTNFLQNLIANDARLLERLKYVYRDDYKLWNKIN